MNIKNSICRAKIVGINDLEEKVTLDTVFSASFDNGAHKFEKHFTKIYYTNPIIIERLYNETKQGDEIEALVENNYETFEMTLIGFKVLS